MNLDKEILLEPVVKKGRKPTIKLTGSIQDLKKKEKNEKINQSNFLLTINTNQQYKEDDPNLQNDIEVFDSTIQTILNNIDEYVKLPENDTWDDKTVKDVKIDYTIERGLKKGQVHIHILLKFKHITKIQLNYQKIKNKIMEDLGLSQGIYMYNRLIRKNESDDILSYLNKYV
jgi:hypothetical protein